MGGTRQSLAGFSHHPELNVFFIFHTFIIGQDSGNLQQNNKDAVPGINPDDSRLL
jgi:hypothetical protein